MTKPTRHINILEILPHLWFENENGDRQIPPAEIQDNPDALETIGDDSGGFIFQHVLVHSVVGHDVVCKVPKTGEMRLVRRDFLPFDHTLVEGLVRKGDFDLRSAMLVAIEACERCVMALRFRYRLGPGYDFDDPLFEGNPARCRICYEPDPDIEPPEWFAAARALIAAATPEEDDAA
jgi:hypothetical protein